MDFKIAFRFLSTLSKNNNRDWFEKNKPKYLIIKESFEIFAADLYHEIIKFDESIAAQDPKKSVFRIYRDVRFSKDKRPYKRNLSAAFSAQGKGMEKPGYYLHIEPGNKSFIGIGLYGPPAENVQKIRQEIDYNGDKLIEIFKDKTFKKFYAKFWDDDALKTSPKGYDKDHQYIEFLRLRSFIVTYPFTDEQVMDKKFLQKVAAPMKAAKPLIDFLSEAIN